MISWLATGKPSRECVGGHSLPPTTRPRTGRLVAIELCEHMHKPPLHELDLFDLAEHPINFLLVHQVRHCS